MEKLMKTSKTLDNILRIVYKLMQVAGIILLVSIGICIVAQFVDKLPMAELTSVSVSDVELTFKEPMLIDSSKAVIEMVVTLVVALLVIGITCYMIKLLRKVLAPMIVGQPFDGTVSKNIKKLGIAVIVNGLAIDIAESVMSSMAFYMYDIAELVLSDNISKIMVNSEVSLDSVLVGVLVIMLSHVFRYGEQLQQQADETL
ncbi:MAG: hypothetical protein J6J44_12675 [Lachnospiraceae bacterium]|nr:hypothetical protein [Lachnospiraceae bacterium]